MTTEDAKTYLSKREIPRLFESLMTGLMYHRPSDHIKYLIDCLQKCHDKGPDNITWSSFVDIRRTKTPLPPINDKKRPSSKEGSRPSSKTRASKGHKRSKRSEEILSLNMGNFEEALVSRVISPASGHVSVISSVRTRTNTPDSERRQLQFSDREESTTPRDSPREKTKSPLPAIPTSSDKFTLPDMPVVLVMGAPGSDKEAHVGRLLERYPDWQHITMGSLIKEEIQRRGEAHTKWKLTKDLMSRGEPASEEVTIEVLMEGLKRCTTAKGIVITGFPRSIGQVSDYEKNVGRVDVAFMIDCDESASTEKLLRKGKNSNKPEYSMASIANKLNFFKAHTLAAAKSYDDQGKLVVIDGEADENMVTYEIGKAFDKLFLSKYGKEAVGEAPPKSAKSAKSEVPEAPTYKGKYEKEDTEEEMEAPMYDGPVPEPPTLSVEDTGRKPDLPQCPIIFVAGGPGSGKGTQCARIIKRYPDLVHLSMGDIIRKEISTKGTADDKWGMVTQLVSKGEMAPEEVTIDLLKEQMMKHKDAKGFLIEGFPRDVKQAEAFNKVIGGLNFIMLFDCEEYFMKTRLLKRGKESGRIDDNLNAIGNRIKFYKNNTIPLMKSFDDQKKLVVIDGDRDMDEMFFDITQLFDFAFFKQEDSPAPKASQDEETPALKASQDDETPAPKASLEEEQAAAATKIQAGFKGYLVRNKQKEEKKAKSEEADKAKSEEADSKPSGKHKQDTHKDSKPDKPNPKHTLSEKEKAAMQIKASFRGHHLRQNVKNKKTETQSKDKTETQSKSKTETQSKDKNTPKRATSPKSKAAMEIRAGFQAHFQRQKGKDMKKSDPKKKSNPPPPKSNSPKSLAAMQIRAGFRGHQLRQINKNKKETKKDSEAAPVQEEVVEPTLTTEEASTTGDNVENPSHTKTLDETAEKS